MTGPHDPGEHPEGDEEAWYGTGYDDGAATSDGPSVAEHPEGPTDPATQPATVRAEPPGPAEAPRPGWGRSRRVRVGAAATLAGLVLLGGGFGAGYAVADASAPPAAHATAAATDAGKGAARTQAARKRRQAAQERRQQQGGAAPGTGTAPGATAGAPTF